MQFLTMEEFVDFIITTHTNHLITDRLGRVPKTVKVAQTANLEAPIKALSSIQGITPHLAEQVMDEFVTIPKLLNSKTSQKQLMKILIC